MTTSAGPVSCAENVEKDRALLDGGTLAHRVAVLGDAALSIGVAVALTAPYLARARAEGWAVVRRSSGGTGVLHAPGDLAWSIVLPRDHPAVGRDFVRAYGRLGAGVVRFLEDEGVAARWAAPANVSEDYCLLSGRGEVLAVDGRVLGGAAQHRSATALLHHGILPLEVDRPTVERLFSVPRSGGTERLVSLRELGIQGTPEGLATRLGAAIALALRNGPPETG